MSLPDNKEKYASLNEGEPGSRYDYSGYGEGVAYYEPLLHQRVTDRYRDEAVTGTCR